ncbi:universal stress protein UspA [Fischerella thermalis CCMEE 5205]|uniref:Universal stress protein UspA n=2 Tax=Fischerella thermalis TaxID=372787 RepID=A0A2N6L9W0_9CYAN|nr:universal stress protein [Fischerella thermalis]PMB19165.1 universal stress protein UspA [Fischerella thermalis CCMEE 5318]PMB28506.1 universal stress protein UspA [Fischerella thermalis CCMEE 5319]PMB41216.1 universal stress protein UspA [Fischerella thermalis CCMEE 5205]
MFYKILVGIDNSEIGQCVFDEALALAQKLNASLMLLHVLDPFDERYPSSIALHTDSLYPSFRPEAVNYYMSRWETLKQEGIEFLKIFYDQAIAKGVTTEYTQNFGEPGRVICEVAQSWKADLIMIGRRGRRGISEFFLGSVSNYVLHHAPCSVLTVQGLIHAIEPNKLTTKTK